MSFRSSRTATRPPAPTSSAAGSSGSCPTGPRTPSLTDLTPTEPRTPPASSIRCSASASRPTGRRSTLPTTRESGSSRRRRTWPTRRAERWSDLNDLRTLGVPYDGQNSAVAVVDTGVDASSPPFRGRVAPGTDIFTGGLGQSRPCGRHGRRNRLAAAAAAGGTGNGRAGEYVRRTRHAGRGRDCPVRAAGDPRAGQHLPTVQRWLS